MSKPPSKPHNAIRQLSNPKNPSDLFRLVVVIMHLAPELQRNRSNTSQVVLLVVQLIVLVIGLVGSWRDNRQLLLTFAIILTVLVIIFVVQSQAISIVGNAILDILAILLAVYQSEMIRSGDL